MSNEAVLKEILGLISILVIVGGFYKLFSEFIKSRVQIAKEKSHGADALAKIVETITQHHNKILDLENRAEKTNSILAEVIRKNENDYKEVMNRILDIFKFKQ